MACLLFGAGPPGDPLLIHFLVRLTLNQGWGEYAKPEYQYEYFSLSTSTST